MERINPADVVQAYRDFDLTPIRNTFFNGRNVCALTALAHRHNPHICEDIAYGDPDEEWTMNQVFDALSSAYDADYLSHFMLGFDGGSPGSLSEEDDVAYRDGVETWNVVVSTFPEVVKG